MKWAYNAFFEGKKAVFLKSLWQERSGIIFQATSGISPIDAIRENSLGFRAKGREVIEGGEGYQVREGAVFYNALFGAGKEDIGPENTYFWNVEP